MQATDPEQSDYGCEDMGPVMAIWMLNLMGDLAKELEDLLIFYFLSRSS